MNKKVIDFVNRLKNLSLVKTKRIMFIYSDLILEYTDCLYREGLIQSYEVFSLQDKKYIRIIIRLENGICLTSKIKLVSSLTKKKYISSKIIASTSIKGKELFLSTSKGVFSFSECKKQRVGGLVVFVC
jgi:ribosomal protein S8